MPPSKRVVAFLSDFGWRDPYAGIVRGVIEKIGGGNVKVIDITHDVPSFSIVAGAYILYASYRYFPEGTVFLAVIDPGVGTERKPIAIRTRRYFFVGPDNGLLYPAASEDGIVEVRVISNESVYLKPVSTSFHGRDIFAPAAALLALGKPIETLGGPMPPSRLVRLKLKSACNSRDRVEAKVVYVDVFGNVALGLEKECVSMLCGNRERVTVRTEKGVFEARCLPVFSMAKPGEMVFYDNSLGFPELAVNLESAAQKLGVKVGDKILIEKC